jgi:hypothetical protein
MPYGAKLTLTAVGSMNQNTGRKALIAVVPVTAPTSELSVSDGRPISDESLTGDRGSR